MAYLTGRRGFHDIELKVTPATLVPRPETELLVELALSLHAQPAARALDLGTGSGAIALALAKARPDWQIVATDRMDNALAVAEENGANLLLQNIEFKLGSWFAPVAGESFDIILSNPPYVAADDPHLAQGDLPHEPNAALVGRGSDGLGDIEEIVQLAPDHLHHGGWLLLEHGPEQTAAIADLLASAGFTEVNCWQDLAGLDRCSGGRRVTTDAS